MRLHELPLIIDNRLVIDRRLFAEVERIRNGEREHVVAYAPGGVPAHLLVGPRTVSPHSHRHLRRTFDIVLVYLDLEDVLWALGLRDSPRERPPSVLDFD